MDRFDNVDQARVEFHRQAEHEQASDPINEDDDLPDPLDRRNREHVAMYQDSQTGEWLPMALKRDDDVFCSGLPLRVVGPARDRRYFTGYYNEWFDDMLFPIEAQYVEDRAPADPNETPMPIFPAEPSLGMMALSAQDAGEEANRDPKAPKGESASFRAMIAHLPEELQHVLRQGLKKHRKDVP